MSFLLLYWWLRCFIGLLTAFFMFWLPWSFELKGRVNIRKFGTWGYKNHQQPQHLLGLGALGGFLRPREAAWGLPKALKATLLLQVHHWECVLAPPQGMVPGVMYPPCPCLAVPLVKCHKCSGVEHNLQHRQRMGAASPFWWWVSPFLPSSKIQNTETAIVCPPHPK